MLTKDQVVAAFRVIDRITRANNISPEMIIANISAIFTQDIQLRIHLTIAQTRGSGAAGLNFVIQAMLDYPDHPVWGVLVEKAKTQTQAVVEAMAFLSQNPHAGFKSREETEKIKATRFPAYAFAGQRLLVELGGKSTAKDYGGKFPTPLQAIINETIDMEKRRAVAALNLDNYSGDRKLDINILLPGFNTMVKNIGVI